MKKQRMTAQAFKKYKSMINELKNMGYKLSEIRDILKIGNGTSQYIDKAKTFEEYCKLRDEMLARAKSQAVRNSKKAISDNPKLFIEKPERTQRRRKYVSLPTDEGTEVSAKEIPVNIERIVQNNFNELREWLEKDYSNMLVRKVVHITTVTIPQEDQDLAIVESDSRPRSWFGRRKSE